MGFVCEDKARKRENLSKYFRVFGEITCKGCSLIWDFIGEFIRFLNKMTGCRNFLGAVIIRMISMKLLHWADHGNGTILF